MQQKGFSQSLTVQCAMKLISREQGRVIVLDVRQPFEAKLSRIQNSLNIPHDRFPEALNDLTHSKVYLVYCRTGWRSLKVVKMMKSSCFDAYHLIGGMNLWKASQCKYVSSCVIY